GSCSPVEGMARVSIGPVAGAGAGAAGGPAGGTSRLHPASGESTIPVAASEATDRNSRRDVMADPPAGRGSPGGRMAGGGLRDGHVELRTAGPAVPLRAPDRGLGGPGRRHA